ncbi:unnamed protein product [Darwinula stevensoni]|uniref:Ig-like domain-containing protein n=1 Tax=Darwinula stevensoni TaxID=69355 RepID=A0A7R8X9I9_9CRUS|nr:unnamed protein product [Darwinula stevensoni]CAG0889041.1 unnamed protein product [Darwinula stevensoni]
MHPQMKAVERGRNAVLMCLAEGDPSPEITWFKDSLPVSLADTRYSISPPGWYLHAHRCRL